MTVLNRSGFICLTPLMAVGLVLSMTPTAVAQPYTFTKVVDIAGPYSNFGFAPVINNARKVAFYADLEGGDAGFFTGPNPATSAVGTINGAYLIFDAYSTINDAGTVVFWAFPDVGGNQGIFRGPNAVTDALLTTTGPFSGLKPPSINDSGQVAFIGFPDGGGEGIYTGPNPVTDTVVTNAGPYETFGTFPAFNDAGDVAFLAIRDDDGLGIYTGPNPATDAVATTDGSYAFLDFPAINDAGDVAFRGEIDDGGGFGIYTGPNPATDAVATSASAYLDFSAPAINEAGTIAFLATIDGGGEGIFTGADPVAHKVIRSGEQLFGQAVAHVGFFRGLNDHGDIAFYYELTDGTRGIAIANANREPGDFNNDGAVTSADIDQFCAELHDGGANNLFYDANGDNVVTFADQTYIVEAILGTTFGDTNTDTDVDLNDLGVLASNYAQSGPFGWADGDFDCDGDVDLVDLGQLATNYEGGAAQAFADFQQFAAVPEPTMLAIFAISATAMFRRVRRYSN